MAEIVDAVAVAPVPAGHDDDDVVRLDGRHGAFKIGDGHQLPLLLGNRKNDTGPEETVERDIADTGAALDKMERRIHMRPAVHDHADPRRHHAVLGMRAGAVELDVVVARQSRHAVAPLMAEFVKDQPGFGLRHTGHTDLPLAAADLGERRATCGSCNLSGSGKVGQFIVGAAAYTNGMTPAGRSAAAGKLIPKAPPAPSI